MSGFKKNGAGFTLIEILVYIAVIAIILVSVLSFLRWAIISSKKQEAMREVLDSGRSAMEIMTREIREAKSVYDPTSTSTQLSLETLKYLPQGETMSYIDFFLCQTQLCFKKESQNPITLTSNKVEVKNLIFRKIVTNQIPSIQIEITVDYKNPKNLSEYQASINLISTASLRAY